MRASALFHVSERRVECREVALAAPGPGEVLIESRCSAISPGTEAMIFSGAFPKDAPLDPAIESLKGRFAYPFSYGYALVGKGGRGRPRRERGMIGRTLFAFHPHQDRAVVPLADCLQGSGRRAAGSGVVSAARWKRRSISSWTARRSSASGCSCWVRA